MAHSDRIEADTLRHALLAIGYRMHKVTDAVPPDFGSFDPGSNVRTPVEILSHMSDVLGFVAKRLDGPSIDTKKLGSWDEEVVRFYAMLSALDEALAGLELLNRDRAERLLQGPFSDVLTHVGQLSMLKRMAGMPIEGENFFEATLDPERCLRP